MTISCLPVVIHAVHQWIYSYFELSGVHLFEGILTSQGCG